MRVLVATIVAAAGLAVVAPAADAGSYIGVDFLHADIPFAVVSVPF